jgi:hypothetical protein
MLPPFGFLNCLPKAFFFLFIKDESENDIKKVMNFHQKFRLRWFSEVQTAKQQPLSKNIALQEDLSALTKPNVHTAKGQ